MSNIAVVGSGAIGGLIAARLARAGVQASVIDQGVQLDAIKKRGLTVTEEGETYTQTVCATSSAEELGVQDIVFVCLKGQTLAQIAGSLKPLIGPDTVIVSVMNGIPWWFLHDFGGELANGALKSVDPTGIVASVLPPEQSIGCVVHLSSSVPEPGVIKKGTGNHLVVGPASSRKQAQAEEIATLLSRGGFEVSSTEEIRSAIWMKLWGNMTMNPISALTRSTCDIILDDPLTEAIVVSIMEEAKLVGERYGISIDMSANERNSITRKFGAFKTSMLQDVEGNRSLEVDALLGGPYELATLAGVPTPWLASVFGLVRQLDRNLTAARAK